MGFLSRLFNNFFDYSYPLFTVIMKFAVANFLWFFFNFPVFVIAMMLFFANSPDTRVLFIFSIVVLLPFLFFPATAALFGIVRDWILHREKRMYASFWKYFRSNYKKSMTAGFLITIVMGISIVDYYYFVERNLLLSYLFLIFIGWTFLFSLYYLSDIVHNDLSQKQHLKNSLLLILSNPLVSIIVAVLCIGIVVISVGYFTFFVPICMGSLIAYVSFKGYYIVFSRVVELKEL